MARGIQRVSDGVVFPYTTALAERPGYNVINVKEFVKARDTQRKAALRLQAEARRDEDAKAEKVTFKQAERRAELATAEADEAAKAAKEAKDKAAAEKAALQALAKVTKPAEKVDP